MFNISKDKLKILLEIAWPLIVANSFWNLQLTIDRVFLGQFSTEALGAAMAVMGVFWVPMALLQQTASYIITFVAQYYGAKEYKKIGPCVWQAFYVSLFGGIGFLSLNFLCAPFFSWVGHEASILSLEVEYFNSLAFSALPMALVAAVSGFFTGLGKSKTVIRINFVGLIFNVFLDYLLIQGNLGAPALGIKGAGYATALASLASAVYGMSLIFRRDFEEKFHIKSQWKIKSDLLWQFLKYGLPSGAQWALEGMAFTVFLMIMGNLANGEAALASSSIAVTLMMLSILPTMGVAQAVMTLVGQKLGQENPKGAEEFSWIGVKISAIYIFVVALSFWIFPEFYLNWFKNEGNLILWTEVLKLAPAILTTVGIFTIFDSLYLNLSFALKGAGDTKFVSIVSLITPWPIMVLPAWLLKNHNDAAIMSWRFAILYAFAVSVILVLRFNQGKWKSMSVIK